MINQRPPINISAQGRKAKISKKATGIIDTLERTLTRLDGSVLEAYGWPNNLSNDGILERLLALNLERAGSG